MKALQTTIEPMQDLEAAQSEIVPYQTNVGTQGFLEMMSIVPTMMIMFFMMMMMGMMKDMMQPGGATGLIAKGAKAAAPALTFIPIAGPAIAAGATAVGEGFERVSERARGSQ